MGSDTVRSVIFDPFIFARFSTLENGFALSLTRLDAVVLKEI